MNTATAETVDSATTTQDEQQQPQTPAFDAADPHTWSPAQTEDWNRTGNQPTKADSATADEKDKTAAPDSAPDKKKTASASDSATEEKDKSQKPHLKTKEDTEKRIQELLDRAKRAEDALAAKAQPEKRDDKQVSQPAPVAVKVPSLKTFVDEYFAKPENKGKSYEDGVEAWQEMRDAENAKQVEQRMRNQIAQEAASREFQVKAQEAKERYPDLDQKVPVAFKALAMDPQIPAAIKAMLDGSDVLLDVMYTLGSDPVELATFVHLAKTDPGAAIRKFVVTESLVKEQLKAAGKNTTTARGEDGKFKADADAASKKEASAETKPRAPKPPSEVGGRGTAPEDALKEAAKAGKFGDFEAEMNRRRQASRS